MSKVELVLASSSPRRRQLLREAGYRFEVVSPPGEEPDGPGHLPPAGQAEAVALFKAESVAASRPAQLVLGADTIVAVGEEILGKPADESDARRMLRTLSGTRHSVITGVALLGPSGRRVVRSDTTFVTMRPMTSQELDAYIRSGEWEGKAGAYAIQETADRFVQRVEGSFTNVVGLPMELVGRLLAEAGVEPAEGEEIP